MDIQNWSVVLERMYDNIPANPMVYEIANVDFKPIFLYIIFEIMYETHSDVLETTPFVKMSPRIYLSS